MISIQTYRGTAGSTTFGILAVWRSAKTLGDAFLSAEFQTLAVGYPNSRTVAAPHVFKKMAVRGVCLA